MSAHKEPETQMELQKSESMLIEVQIMPSCENFYIDFSLISFVSFQPW